MFDKRLTALVAKWKVCTDHESAAKAVFNIAKYLRVILPETPEEYKANLEYIERNFPEDYRTATTQARTFYNLRYLKGFDIPKF